jgi:hypothetical protein
MRTLALSALGAALVLAAGCDTATTTAAQTYCWEKCTTNDQCKLAAGGDYECKDSMCTAKATAVAPPPKCTDDAYCMGLKTVCAKDAECNPALGEVCVEDGGGRCATDAEFAKVAGGCTTFAAADHKTKKKEGGGDVTVCAGTSAPYCNAAGGCDECKTDAECDGKAMPKCMTGWCIGCKADTDCKGDLTKCTSESTCGCKDDTQCKSSTSDKCYSDGSCGCTAATACTATKTFEGTSIVCEKQP